MTWLERRIPPPVVGALVAAAMWAVAALGPPLPLRHWHREAPAAVLAVAGLAFDLLGVLAFRAARTTINPLRPERARALVTGGVYRVTRNPMYVGMGLLLLAWAVHLGTVLPFAGPVIYAAYVTRFQIRAEERVLRQLFGDEYAAYAARVRRWL